MLAITTRELVAAGVTTKGSPLSNTEIDSNFINLKSEVELKAPLISPTFIGTTTAADLAYTGTLTGSTGILNIGSGQLYKDASGNVGIGTSSPTQKLQVAGSQLLSSPGSAVYTYFDGTSNSIGRKVTGELAITVASGSPITFVNSTTEQMRIDSSGNVGIGTSSPSTYGKLAVVGGNFYTSQAASPSGWAATTNANSNAGTYYFQLYTGGGNNVGQHSCNSSGEYLITTYSTTALLLGTNSTERMRIDSSGRVGIGGTPSAVALEVISTGAILVAKGTTAQQPTGVAGYLRFNTTTAQFEGHNGTVWASVGGSAITNDTTTATEIYPLCASATSGTALNVYTSNTKYVYTPSTGELESPELLASNGMVLNNSTVSSSYTIPVGYNATATGPMNVASGVVITIPSGSRWMVL